MPRFFSSRNRWWYRASAPVVAAAAMMATLAVQAPASPAPPSGIDTNPDILASTADQAAGEQVDGISSNDMEHPLFHIHAHVSIYVNGVQKLLPYGIGIVPPYVIKQTENGPFVTGGAGFYWLHVHDETGVIHIESPVQRGFTLGNVFDIWRQPLSWWQAGPATGPMTVFVDGHLYTGNPRDIPLRSHTMIQLDLGTVVPFQPYTFTSGL